MGEAIPVKLYLSAGCPAPDLVQELYGLEIIVSDTGQPAGESGFTGIALLVAPQFQLCHKPFGDAMIHPVACR